MGYYYKDPQTGSSWWVDDNETPSTAKDNPWGGASNYAQSIDPNFQAALKAAGATPNNSGVPTTPVSYTPSPASVMQPLLQQSIGPEANRPAGMPNLASTSNVPPLATLGAGNNIPKSRINGVPIVTDTAATAAGQPTTGANPNTTGQPTLADGAPNVNSRGILSTITGALNNPIAPVIESIGGMAANLVGINAATNALTQGGEKAQNQIQTGATNAENTLGTTLNNATQNEKDIIAQNNTTLNPYQAAGASGLNTLENMQPFSFNPNDLQNDPGYQFRLKQGEQAIQNAASAGGGSSLSGATLKGLDQFAGGEASQEYQNAYNRALGTYQQNLQVPTQLSNLGASAAATGVNANTSVGNIIGQITSQYGTNMAGIQTGTANAIAGIQTQIASAVASGDIATANALTSTLSQLAAWAQNNGIVQALGKQNQNQGKPSTDTSTSTSNPTQTVTINLPDGTTKTVQVGGTPTTNTNTNTNTQGPPQHQPPVSQTGSSTTTIGGQPTNEGGTVPFNTIGNNGLQPGQSTTLPNGDSLSTGQDGSYTVTNPQSGQSYTYPPDTPYTTVLQDSVPSAPYDQSSNGTTLDQGGSNPGDTGAGDFTGEGITSEPLTGSFRRPVGVTPATQQLAQAAVSGQVTPAHIRALLKELGVA